jgi:hypothetical protein
MSVGMIVAGDLRSGEDSIGTPNLRDICRRGEILDVSAVAFWATPVTSVELAAKRRRKAALVPSDPSEVRDTLLNYRKTEEVLSCSDLCATREPVEMFGEREVERQASPP